MKKILFAMIALFTMLVFISVAPAAAKKSAKTKTMKASGMVSAYETGKTITVKDAKGKEMTFEIAADAKVSEGIKDGAKVKVTYHKVEKKMVANSISIVAAKAKKK